MVEIPYVVAAVVAGGFVVDSHAQGPVELLKKPTTLHFEYFRLKIRKNTFIISE